MEKRRHPALKGHEIQLAMTAAGFTKLTQLHRRWGTPYSTLRDWADDKRPMPEVGRAALLNEVLISVMRLELEQYLAELKSKGSDTSQIEELIQVSILPLDNMALDSILKLHKKLSSEN